MKRIGVIVVFLALLVGCSQVEWHEVPGHSKRHVGGSIDECFKYGYDYKIYKHYQPTYNDMYTVKCVEK